MYEVDEKGLKISKKNPLVEVYYAPTQAGKTNAALNFSYLCVLMGISSVFISMNSLNQGKQLKKRVYEYNNMKRCEQIDIMRKERFYFKRLEPWWWSSCQRALLLLRRPEFQSC